MKSITLAVLLLFYFFAHFGACHSSERVLLTKNRGWENISTTTLRSIYDERTKNLINSISSDVQNGDTEHGTSHLFSGDTRIFRDILNKGYNPLIIADYMAHNPVTSKVAKHSSSCDDARDCNERGQCIKISETVQHCECFDGAAGQFCSLSLRQAETISHRTESYLDPYKNVRVTRDTVGPMLSDLYDIMQISGDMLSLAYLDTSMLLLSDISKFKSLSQDDFERFVFICDELLSILEVRKFHLFKYYALESSPKSPWETSYDHFATNYKKRISSMLDDAVNAFLPTLKERTIAVKTNNVLINIKDIDGPVVPDRFARNTISSITQYAQISVHERKINEVLEVFGNALRMRLYLKSFVANPFFEEGKLGGFISEVVSWRVLNLDSQTAMNSLHLDNKDIIYKIPRLIDPTLLNVRPYSFACLLWRDDLDLWESTSCQYVDDTGATENFYTCKCNKIGTVGVVARP